MIVITVNRDSFFPSQPPQTTHWLAGLSSGHFHVELGASAGVISAGVATTPSVVGASAVAVVGASAGPPDGVISAGVAYVAAARSNTGSVFGNSK